MPRTFPIHGHPLRVINRQGRRWFVLDDVHRILALGEQEAHCCNADPADVKSLRIVTPSGIQALDCVNDRGLFADTFEMISCVWPDTIAYDFCDWVAQEVPLLVDMSARFRWPTTLSADQLAEEFEAHSRTLREPRTDSDGGHSRAFSELMVKDLGDDLRQFAACRGWRVEPTKGGGTR